VNFFGNVFISSSCFLYMGMRLEDFRETSVYAVGRKILIGAGIIGFLGISSNTMINNQRLGVYSAEARDPLTSVERKEELRAELRSYGPENLIPFYSKFHNPYEVDE